MTHMDPAFGRYASAARWAGVAGVVIGLLATAPITQAATPTLHETGSTLLYPLFQRWISAYAATDPGTAIVAAATGSGAGIAQAVAGKVEIGASDAYMSDEQAEHNPGIVDIPLAIAAQTVNYNIPGLNAAKLRLDGPTLAGIYAGRIGTWDAQQIAALNPGVPLPHRQIVPIRRADASGDTFIFTQFLDFSTQSWEDAVGYGTTVAWPATPAGRTATGNLGMLQSVSAVPYSIGYIGISFHNEIAKAGLGTARLKNQAGRFLLPTAETVAAAAAELDPRTPADERLSLVFAPGENSYPLINYEYAVVSIHQKDLSTATALRRFLLWLIRSGGGNSTHYLDAVQFAALPDFVRALSENQIDRIGPRPDETAARSQQNR